MADVRLSVAADRRRIPSLSLVVPCYNEADVLDETTRRLSDLVEEFSTRGIIAGGRIYFVDDGSTDCTWELIEKNSSQNPRIHGIKLSRNCGHQAALLAGLLKASGDVIVSIDADLQDDPGAIAAMLTAWREGADVVYGVRRERRTDTAFKRTSAEAYYVLLRAMGVHLVFNHADYRLLSRPVIEALRAYKETNLFLRGLIPQLGFRSAQVCYDRQERFAGESKYTLSKMLALAIEGVTSFSEVPLRAITVLGLLISVVSFGMAAWALWAKIAHFPAVPGWASTVIPLYMLGGVQLLCMGMIGQYLAKIYSETKSRPRFIVEKESPVSAPLRARRTRKPAARRRRFPLPVNNGSRP